MFLSTVLLLVAASVVVAPIAVRVVDRMAGWPLALMFFAAGGILAFHLPDSFAGHPLTVTHTWIENFPADGINVTLNFTADPLSSFFALLALFIGGIVLVYSTAYLHNNDGNTSFYWLMTAFTFSIVLLVLTDDIVVLFVAWELVSMASFMLIGRAKGSSGQMGSIRTLILTFTGGLTLLTSLVIIVSHTGTTSIAEIVHHPFWAQNPRLTGFLAVLIAVSAFTKSAQLPFHFWLPEAMAAATPVSAFLHAAAVVKAGIYVLMRFSTVFSTNHTWNVLLISVGMTTAVVASYFAVQKTDLKKLTAYSTVSHLGWLVATIGVGTPFALAAALVHTLAHGLFKSSLFMLIGVIDHQTGSRDIRRLGPLYKKMPFTFISATVGLLSMAAVPPLFGFVSKEGMLDAFTQAPLTATGVTGLLIAAGVGAWFTFNYSAKFLFGAFIDGDRDVSKVQEAPVALWLPAALPGLLSIPVVLVLGWLEMPISAAVTEITGEEPHLHLALWHGVTTPLLISLGVLTAGVVSVIYRRPLFTAMSTYESGPFTGNQALSVLMGSAAGWGKFVGRMADTFSPSRHILLPIGLLCALGAASSLLAPGVDGVPTSPPMPGLDSVVDIVPLIIVIMSVSGLVRSKSRLQAVVLVGTAGVGITLQMLVLGAPDVALTQFTVEILVTVMMALVVRQQPRYFHKVSRSRRYWAAVTAIVAGIVTFMAVYGLLGRHERSALADWYILNGPDITGGNNVVATIIVEFRALDTMGELSVLGMAGVVIYSVVKSLPKRSFLPGTRPVAFGDEGINALPLRHVLQVITPVFIVLSVVLFWRGHHDPGGGFIAALVAGGALCMKYLAKPEDGRVVKHNTPFVLVGCGIILALSAGFVGYLHGGFLYAIHGEFLGQHLTTSMVFDGGIYLAVLGMITMGINALGGRLRPGASPNELAHLRDESSPLPAIEFHEDPEKELDDPEYLQGMDTEDNDQGKKVHS